MGDLKNIIIMAFIILAFSIPGVASADDNNSSVVKTLYAGQDIEAGTVTVSNDCDYVNITYRTNANWSILETHLDVADSLDGIPMTKSGNPVPGHFAYGNDSLQNGTNMIEYMIPLPAENGTLYIAAHAAIRDETNNSSTDEGAWAEGSSFPGKNWATYFTYEIRACEDESGSPADDGSNNEGDDSDSSDDDSSSGDNDSDSSDDDNSDSSSDDDSSENGDPEDLEDNDSSSDDDSGSSGGDDSSDGEDNSDPADDDSSSGDGDDSDSSDDDSSSDNDNNSDSSNEDDESSDDGSSSEDNGSDDQEDGGSDSSDDSSDSGDSDDGSDSSGDSPGSSDNGRSSNGGSGGSFVAEEAQTESESDDNERAYMAVDAVEEEPEAPVTIPVEEPESSNPVSEIIPKLSNTLWFIIWTLLSAICVMSGYGLTQP